MTLLALFISLVFLHSLASARLQRTVVTAPMVFTGSPPASQLIANAKMDRHPFVFDQTQPTPGEQQRWVIVERHAAASRPAPKAQ